MVCHYSRLLPISFFLGFVALGAQAEVYNAETVEVISGDTLSLKVNRDGEWETMKVRIRGIDAPEMNQDGGKRAQMTLSALIQGRKLIAECEDIDTDDNYLCSVATNNRLDTGLYLLERGLVWVDPRSVAYMKSQWQNVYVSAELMARKKHRGLFAGGQQPISPWEWRKTHPEPVAAAKTADIPELKMDDLAEVTDENLNMDEASVERTQLHVAEPTTWYGKLFMLAETWCTEAWGTFKSGLRQLYA